MISQRGTEPNPDKIGGRSHAESEDQEGGPTLNGKDICLDPVHISHRGWEFALLQGHQEGEKLLARLIVGDVLQLYLTVSMSTISSVLIQEEGKVQRPVY
ncbi:hypothetical protein LIER_40062 [Lithospermum erythrorhizon]|uniref:Uncharacterized protein n=1 Tax=Lithospermum erythrorhizon TaxID=34254 RepID=A0AAV3QSH0_LITER